MRVRVAVGSQAEKFQTREAAESIRNRNDCFITIVKTHKIKKLAVLTFSALDQRSSLYMPTTVTAPTNLSAHV
jgi:hypothetical protein